MNRAPRAALWDRSTTSRERSAMTEAVGIESIGVECHREYYNMAKVAIPRLKNVETPFK